MLGFEKPPFLSPIPAQAARSLRLCGIAHHSADAFPRRSPELKVFRAFPAGLLYLRREL